MAVHGEQEALRVRALVRRGREARPEGQLRLPDGVLDAGLLRAEEL